MCSTYCNDLKQRFYNLLISNRFAVYECNQPYGISLRAPQGDAGVAFGQPGMGNLALAIGIIIVAVGASLFKPTGLFNYDGQKRITQNELEIKLKNNDVKANDVVMIQCVGSRIEERMYCSAVCCMTALKNGLAIKEKNPDAHITILFRDLNTPGTHYEDYYERAREAGIVFIEYSPDKMPVVEDNQIKVHNEYIGQDKNPKPEEITSQMVNFLKDLGCGKIKRNYRGYPFQLLFPDEVEYEEL